MIGVIFNPLCRLGNSTQKIKNFMKKMDAAGLEYVYRTTSGPGDATDIARELADTCDIILSVGGDGTIHEIVNGVYDKDVKLVILPYGSGNDLSISIYGKDPSDEEIIEILKHGVEKKVDYAVVNNRYIMDMMAGFGLVVEIQERYLQYGGSYVRSMFATIVRRKNTRYTVKVNDQVRFYKSELLVIMNCMTAGAGILLDKDADLSDGKMELVVINNKGVIRRARNLVALLRGKLGSQKNVDVVSAEEITVIPERTTLVNLDGELLRFNELNLKVSGKSLTFLVNPNAHKDSILESILKKSKKTVEKVKSHNPVQHDE